MRFDTLLRHGLGDSFRVTALEMSSKQVAEPTLQQWNDTTQEEEPYSPAWRPESTSRTLADWSSVEAVIDDVLQILALKNDAKTRRSILAQRIQKIYEDVINHKM